MRYPQSPRRHKGTSPGPIYPPPHPLCPGFRVTMAGSSHVVISPSRIWASVTPSRIECKAPRHWETMEGYHMRRKSVGNHLKLSAGVTSHRPHPSSGVHCNRNARVQEEAVQDFTPPRSGSGWGCGQVASGNGGEADGYEGESGPVGQRLGRPPREEGARGVARRLCNGGGGFRLGGRRNHESESPR